MVRIHPDPPVSRIRDRQRRKRGKALTDPDPWHGAVAQLGERLLCKQEAVGSIPSSSTTSGDRGQGTGHRRNGLGTTYRLRHGTAVNAFDLTKVSGVEGCRSLTIREGKAHSGLMRVRMRRVELYLACAPTQKAVREWRKHARNGGPGDRVHGYGVKRLSACDGCLGDYRR